MQNNRRNIFITLGVIILIILIVAGLLVRRAFKNVPVSPGSEIATGTVISTATSSLETVGSNTSVIQGVTVINPTPQKVSTPAPALDRSIPNTSGLNQEMVATAKANMAVTIANLKKDPTSFHDWIDLGVERKTLGDYTGAQEDWYYVGLLYPQNSVSFADLGDLYANFLHDTVKAEANYNQQISITPTNIDMYRNLYNLYTDEGNTALAVNILQKGIAANPTAYDLDVLLARYYRNAGNTASAKTYYNTAISVAQKQGNTSAANSLQTELAEIQ